MARWSGLWPVDGHKMAHRRTQCGQALGLGANPNAGDVMTETARKNGPQGVDSQPAQLALFPPQPISHDVLLEKYAKGDERSVDDVRARVARALAAVEARRRARSGRRVSSTRRSGFIPGGRINSAAGTALGATLINCFVQPVGDSISETEDGKPGIYIALMEAAETMRRGGGVGYDFSPIRPKGALVRGTHEQRARPGVLHARVRPRCETVESAGARRGAQMGVLRCDHPDVEDFIHAKDTRRPPQLQRLGRRHRRLHARGGGRRRLGAGAQAPSPARREGRRRDQRADGLWVYRTSKARDLWKQIMRSTYDHAEPGVLFIDRINADNNLHYCEAIEATNPCGEQAAADLRLLLPRPHQSDAVSSTAVQPKARLRLRRVCEA